ncbi:unnamed protein product [Jaminaea pallidilutea]
MADRSPSAASKAGPSTSAQRSRSRDSGRRTTTTSPPVGHAEDSESKTADPLSSPSKISPPPAEDVAMDEEAAESAAVMGEATGTSSSRPTSAGPAGSGEKVAKPIDGRSAKSAPGRRTPTHLQNNARGPDAHVNYKAKFHKARTQWQKALAESQSLSKGLREAQTKQRKLQDEMDWIMDCIAQQRGDLMEQLQRDEEEDWAQLQGFDAAQQQQQREQEDAKMGAEALIALR